MPTFRLVIKLEPVQESNLPDLIEALRKAGRLLHTDVCLIVGREPLPEIVMYGEDLVHPKKE